MKPLSLTFIYCYLLLYIVIYCYVLLYIVIYCYILLYIISCIFRALWAVPRPPSFHHPTKLLQTPPSSKGRKCSLKYIETDILVQYSIYLSVASNFERRKQRRLRLSIHWDNVSEKQVCVCPFVTIPHPITNIFIFAILSVQSIYGLVWKKKTKEIVLGKSKTDEQNVYSKGITD